MTEKEQLQQDIKDLEAQIEPKRKRLNEIYVQEHEEVKSKIGRVVTGKDCFKVDELVFAATNRCVCGAGLAYPKKTGPWGEWDCSAVLLGQVADPLEKLENGKFKHATYPFSFYEIKSENQPSANGATTRPEK